MDECNNYDMNNSNVYILFFFCTFLSALGECIDAINAYYEKFLKLRISGIHYSSRDDLDVTHTNGLLNLAALNCCPSHNPVSNAFLERPQ